MEYEVRVTTQAQEQLREIRDYIANELFAPDAAQKTLQLLASAMATLAHMPGRVRLVDEEPWRSEDVRMKAMKIYLMYFWIDEEKKLVQVFAVIYARRDQVIALISMEM